jgi:hypothetical protein
MLTEDDVIDAVRDYLIRQRWQILLRATALQRGYDLVAKRGDEQLIIEAKGAGSSKAGTARYGKEFDRGQVFDHVAKAILKALRVVSAASAQGGIALPDNEFHRGEIASVGNSLRRLGIVVYWVDDSRAVRVES